MPEIGTPLVAEQIRRAVESVEPGARIILYGSRARGDARPDSDWKLLILVDGPVDHRRKRQLGHCLYKVELDSGQVLSPMLCNRQDWDSSAYRAMPLRQQVEREGIPLPVAEPGGLVSRTEIPRSRSETPVPGRPPRKLHSRIRDAVLGVEPGADIILFGSRARGEARPDSDWDLLILVDGLVDEQRKRAICHRLYEVERSAEEVLCPVVRSRQAWRSPLYRAMPFHQNVERDGISL